VGNEPFQQRDLFPDPGKIRDLPSRWADVATQLSDFTATLASPTVPSDWPGRGRDSAADGGNAVAERIGTVANNCWAIVAVV